MRKFIVMSGGFHPFHAGHMSLYEQAKQAFPDSTILVCATNVQSARPFPFELKQKLAQLSGVPKNDFIEVSRQFSAEDPALLNRIQDLNNSVVIFVRSDKDKNEQPQGLNLNPRYDDIPLVSRGPNKGKPIKLLNYEVNKDNLQPAKQHTYIAYLKTVEFGPGITSASEIRDSWPRLNLRQKLSMIYSLYPKTRNNQNLAQNVVNMFNEVLGTNNLSETKIIPVTPIANTQYTKQEKKQIVRLPKDKKLDPSVVVKLQHLDKKISEAKNLAQQAAIAINLKKKGIKPETNENELLERKKKKKTTRSSNRKSKTLYYGLPFGFYGYTNQEQSADTGGDFGGEMEESIADVIPDSTKKTILGLCAAMGLSGCYTMDDLRSVQSLGRAVTAVQQYGNAGISPEDLAKAQINQEIRNYINARQGDTGAQYNSFIYRRELNSLPSGPIFPKRKIREHKSTDYLDEK